ncbi:hypothetical protein KZ810_03385 [Sphingomonas sp. RHCKR47]|nr:hypothetical protein [Sphingomonas citricola]
MPPNDKPESTAESCQATFAGADEDQGLADKIDREHPNLACEAFPVSPISPGPVSEDETLLRVMVSPRDVDDAGFVHETPFRKIAKNGLSVIRSIAARHEVEALVSDGMYSKVSDPPKQIRAAYEAKAGSDGLRGLVDSTGERVLGVYDQTVPQSDKSAPHIPTHAGIFLRLPAPGTAGRKLIQKDFAGQVREMFLSSPKELASLHDGLFIEINSRSAEGQFVKAPDANK